MTSKPPSISSSNSSGEVRETKILVLWWMQQCPYVAIFDNQIAAEAAANVRNALMVTLSGRDVKIDAVVDWYRRDEQGKPLPAEFRDVGGQVISPFRIGMPRQ